MPYAEMSSFVKGKKSGRGGAEGPLVVTVIYGPDLDREACRFFGCRPRELRALLLALRDEGRLIHNRGRLRQTVRVDDGAGGLGRRQAIVLRGRAEEYPRRRRLRPFAA